MKLDPKLRLYFSTIDVGSIGVGDGVFDTVGARRWWVRVLISFFVAPDVLFSVWERSVAFTVHNTPNLERGRPAVQGERIFRLAEGDRVMRDLIVATSEGLVDILGSRRQFRALFAANTVDGELHLMSTRVALRFGRHYIHIPRFVAPRVKLSERYSPADARQHVAVSVSLPLVGTVYEYAGSFSYKVQRVEQ